MCQSKVRRGIVTLVALAALAGLYYGVFAGTPRRSGTRGCFAGALTAGWAWMTVGALPLQRSTRA